MSVWKDIREKSLGKSFRKEDAENVSFTALPASTNVTINRGGFKRTVTVNHSGTGRTTGQIKANILKLIRKHNWFVDKINQLDNETFNDCMSGGLMDDWMVPEQKTKISIDDATSSIESLGDVGLRDLEKSIYLKCLDLEKEYDRKKSDYDHHQFPKNDVFDLPF